MTRLWNPWPERETRAFAMPKRREIDVREVRPDDVVQARRLMSGADGWPCTLAEAAQKLGVLASDLDVALWERLGHA